MKRVLLIAVLLLVALLLVAATLSLGQVKNKMSAKARSNPVEATLIALEKQAWEAFKNKDGKFFQNFMSEDSMLVGDSDISDKAATVKFVNDSPCEVRSYSLNNFKVTMLDKDAAIVTYKAMQDITCTGKAGPAQVMASSVYVKRGGKWLAAFHQETATIPKSDASQ